MAIDENVVKLGQTADVPLGEGRVLKAGDKSLAVFNVDGEFFALDNTCPHRGASLGEGKLEGCVIRCPWHGWKFDVKTGEPTGQKSADAVCYKVHADGDDLLVVL